MTGEARHDRIGPTAHYTAYVWKRAGLPHADLLVTPQGAALYWGFFAAGEWMTRLSSRTPSMRVYLEYRHRLIDAVVAEHAPDRLLEVGAGLTRRTVSYAARGIEAVDFDLPAMARRKQDALARAPMALRDALRRHHRVHAADVTEPVFAERLRASIGGAKRPVVVAEGLLSYLGERDRQTLYRSVSSVLGPEGLFVCDLHTIAGQATVGRSASVLRTAIRGLTRRKKALDPYASKEAVREAFAEPGLSVTFVEASSHYDREPKLRTLHSPTHIVRASILR